MSKKKDKFVYIFLEDGSMVDIFATKEEIEEQMKTEGFLDGIDSDHNFQVFKAQELKVEACEPMATVEYKIREK